MPREIPALLRYVDEADIDDVAVFANVEEINTGHMSFDEQDVYLAMMRKISALLAEKGVTMLLTSGTASCTRTLAKTLRPEQNFRPMVDVKRSAPAVRRVAEVHRRAVRARGARALHRLGGGRLPSA